MTTRAQSSKGIKLAVMLNGVKTYFEEVKAVPEIGETPEKIDVTHLTSSAHEYVKDIPDYSADLVFTMNAQPYVSDGSASSSNLNLIETLDKNGAYTWIVEYPQLNQTVSLVGDWSYALGAGAVSQALEINLTIIPRTAPTFMEYGIDSFTLSFDPASESGTGTGTMSSQTVAPMTKITVPASTFTAPANKVFGSWNTQADGEGESFNLNDSIVMDNDYTLYAIWADDNSS